MTSTRTRIGVVGAGFGVGFVVVLLHLWLLMVDQQAAWAQRSHENRWSFRAVPSQRGALRDRRGRVLVVDQPTTQLALHYQRFRQRHPVGAAVHGAITWASQQPARNGTTYGYSDGVLGPVAAARDLLAMPASRLRPRVLEKHVAADLAMTVTTVLAHASGWPRARVYKALREAAQGDREIACGDVLPMPRHELLAVAHAQFHALRDLDAELASLDRERRARLGLPGDEQPGLLGTLELLRRHSLADAHVEWEENGVVHTGSAIESIRRTFADHVPFDLAARLRITADRHPGLEVLPAVERTRSVAEDSALRALLGNLQDLDRAVPDEAWFTRYGNRELPADWLDELVPEGLVDGEDARTAMQADAADRYRRELLRRERRGVTGIEAAFDDTLMGRVGMRFVEHDSKRREHRLWSNLQVQPGDDVVLTIDRDLQRLAERATVLAFQRERARFPDEVDQKKCEAALCVIDARTGDVLAYGGAPIVSARAIDVPGVVWQGNGAIGSVVKPLVLVEQLQCESAGRPHRPIAGLEACAGSFPYAGRTLRCTHAHWAGGTDPVQAIAQSCNLFFYQVGIGLGDDGVARALQRFGLLEAPAGSVFAACWQPNVRGLAAARPRLDASRLLPQRAIGYGVAASPLHVARAYAVFATGHLPTVGLRAGERRPSVPFDDVVGELEVVRDGLRACVESGTAKHLAVLQELGVAGKTGTAEVHDDGQNNAWFAGYLPDAGGSGAQLCVCAVVYWVQDKRHGGDAAGQIVCDFLADLRADDTLRALYLPATGGR